jgi:molybdenum cofactor cytidylyltransferase
MSAFDSVVDSTALDVLILAAGASHRFGGCKLLAQWRGMTLLEHVLDRALALQANSVNVVIGGYAEELRTICGREPWSACRLLYCPDWALGMGSSLAFGIAQLPAANAVLVLLADQPAVELADLNRILACGRTCPDRIVCAEFAGTLGVPALFPPAFKHQLLHLKGDRGAKVLLLQNPAEPIPIASAALDIDTPSDLSQLQQSISGQQ